MSKFLKLVSTGVLCWILLLAAVVPAYAFDGRGGDTVTLPADEVVNDDLYVGATEFFMDGTINGDLIAAGRTLMINGTVNGNVIAAAQTVVVNGSVTGDVLAGGSVLLFGEKASIGGDVVSAGYSLEFREGGTVGRDAILAAAQILMAGDVARDLRAGTAALEIAGQVGGDVQAAVGEAGSVQPGPQPTVFTPQSPVTAPIVRQGLTLDAGAKILGNLEYTQNNELAFPAGVIAGQVTRVAQPEGSGKASREPSTGERAGQWALDSFRSLVTLILIGLVLLLALPGLMRSMATELGDRPWASLGWGVVTYAGFFFLVLLTVFAMVLGAVLFGVLTLGSLSATVVWAGLLVLFALIVGFVLATAFVAKIVFGMTLGKWLLSQAHSPLAEHRYWPMLIGVAIIVAVLAVLTFPLIPGVLGWLLNLVIVLFGMGTIWMWLRQKMQKAAPASV